MRSIYDPSIPCIPPIPVGDGVRSIGIVYHFLRVLQGGRAEIPFCASATGKRFGDFTNAVATAVLICYDEIDKSGFIGVTYE